MIGDFVCSANALWSLYGKEAKSHDESRIQTLKEDMDGVLIFVSSYCRAQRVRACARVFARARPVFSTRPQPRFSLLAHHISIAYFTPLPSHIRLVAGLPPVVKYRTFVLPYLSFVPAARELR